MNPTSSQPTTFLNSSLARCSVLLLALFPLCFATGLIAQEPSDPPGLIAEEPSLPPGIQRLRAEKMANAAPASLVSPFYSVGPGDETVLYLINTFAEPLEIEVTLLSPRAEELSLGGYLLEPTRHLRIPLKKAVSRGASGFSNGSVRIDYLGDSTMLQAWAVLQRGAQTVEWPLAPVGDTMEDSTKRFSFWDTRLLGEEVRPTYHLVNGGELGIHYKLHFGQEQDVLNSRSGTLAPGERLTVSPGVRGEKLLHGWLQLEHDGQPDTVFGLGLLEDSRAAPIARAAGREPYLGRLEVVDSTMLGWFIQYESLGIPWIEDTGVTLALLNAMEWERTAELTLLAMETGEELLRTDLVLAGGEIRSVDLASLVPQHLAADMPSEVRMRVRADTGALRLWAASRTAAGEVVEVELFNRATAHQNGLYPLPSLDEYEVINTMVNLGTEPALVLAQVFWAGGTVALEPIEIAPGHAHRLDMAEVAAQPRADELGRKLDPGYRGGFLQWTSQRGAGDIIARTEVRPRGGRDRFGFNCGSCCYEESFGDIIPGNIIINFNVNSNFKAMEYIGTCNTILGPYTPSSIVSLNYSSPVTWNGVTTSSSSDTDQLPGFTGYGEEVFDDGYDCIQSGVLYDDSGRVRADGCREDNNPNHDTARSCADQSSSCANCYTCCEKEKSVAVCRCGGNSTCKQLAKLACGTCKQHCLGSNNWNNCSVNTNC